MEYMTSHHNIIIAKVEVQFIHVVLTPFQSCYSQPEATKQEYFSMISIGKTSV